MSKWIDIVEEEPAKLTKRWAVINNRTQERCGSIRWYGGFRKYVFFPTDGFLFDAECLEKVMWYLVKVNIEHRMHV